MSRLLVVKVFREDTMESASGVRVTLGGGYGEQYTDRSGRAVFELPNNVSYVDVFVNGKTAKSNYYVGNGELRAIVSRSGYFMRTI